MRRRFCFLVNPAAGGGRALARWRGWQPLLQERGLSGEVLLSEKSGAADLALEHLTGQFEVVVAVGGDGWVNEVGSALLRKGSSVPLGILPAGSGNDAAHMVGVHSLSRAIDALATGAPRGFDAIGIQCHQGGQPSERFGFVVAGTGLAADILRHVPFRLKRWVGGRAGYAAGFFSALREYHPQTATVRTDDHTTTDTLAAVVVANHTHAGGQGMHIGPGAQPDDGWLEVSVVRGLSRWAAAMQFLRLVRGTHIRHPAVRYTRAREIEVTSNPTSTVQTDGEGIGESPVRMRVLPGALRVLVPAAR